MKKIGERRREEGKKDGIRRKWGYKNIGGEDIAIRRGGWKKRVRK